MLYTGIGWEDLPQELACGSVMTCWRRLKRWTDAGVFDRLHRMLLADLNAAGPHRLVIDYARAPGRSLHSVWAIRLLRACQLGHRGWRDRPNQSRSTAALPSP
ncbi:transposase [Krasilnikovia sp. MM14-A1004]|uniref:transposase n=1 Tax=Krasilnikovia sp. MM14-A1004 TaxID=3373541 RepID=UPI00399C83D0